MQPADAALFVDHEDGRPGFNAISLPGFVIIVSDDRILNSQRRHFAADDVDYVLALSLRRVHTDNRQTSLAITRVPFLDRRQSVAAVVATERPEFYQYDAAAQLLK